MPERFLAVESAAVAYGGGREKRLFGKSGKPRPATPALRGLSVSFEPGALTLIMGPSGSGKTTLLSLLGCLLTPDSGAVYVDGAETSRLTENQRAEIRRSKIGFIFQAFRLFRSLSALDNVIVGAELGSRRATRTMAQDLLARFGLEQKFQLTPDALSGGEKQRVAIARALIKDPPILLADEPTASLDSAAGERICCILRSLAEEQGRTVVVVSHDARWMEYARRVITLRDGTVMEDVRRRDGEARKKAMGNEESQQTGSAAAGAAGPKAEHFRRRGAA